MMPLLELHLQSPPKGSHQPCPGTSVPEIYVIARTGPGLSGLLITELQPLPCGKEGEDGRDRGQSKENITTPLLISPKDLNS